MQVQFLVISWHDIHLRNSNKKYVRYICDEVRQQRRESCFHILLSSLRMNLSHEHASAPTAHLNSEERVLESRSP